MNSDKMIVSVSPFGNFGNRMIEYMVALTIGNLISQEVEYNVHLPEWGLNFDEHLHLKLTSDKENALVIHDADVKSTTQIINLIRSKGFRNVVFEGFFQRIDLLYDHDFYKSVFPIDVDDELKIGDNSILINIRSSEIRNGYSWYPLVPPKFYKYLVDQTGLTPVFMGQLEDCAYLREIVAMFPLARMIQSAGALRDFNRLRLAKNICISVSTFSWLGAWLSDAEQIHYPLLGFLHPSCFKPGRHGLGGIDLCPAEDKRYRFHLLPLILGEEETIYLEFVKNLDPIAKEIPRSIATFLKKGIPILPESKQAVTFDQRWYLKSYPLAAWEVSEGWYVDALHHYIEIGRIRNYKPHADILIPKSKKISDNKAAVQSSISQWSIGDTVEADAARAVDGNPFKDIAFHTGADREPWWQVDLEEIFAVECVNIYNRRSTEDVRRRLFPFVIETSRNGEVWNEIFRSSNDIDVGANEDSNVPLQLFFDDNTIARFIRIKILKESEFLHLAAVEVFGEPHPKKIEI